MKNLFLWFAILFLFSCNASSNEDALNDEENVEVENMIKSDQEKSDSVERYWKEKMEK